MNECTLQGLECEPIVIGRYVLHRQIARGGMATIHIARLLGDEGFNRIVAAKRLNPELSEDAEFVAMFLDEARVASKVQHRNVVPVLDVVAAGDEVILVQEYVHGVPLHWLFRAQREGKLQLPLNIAVSIACQLLSGLHATHETTDELGTPLHIVHRDVSPQNVMLAVDGSARLLDFGVAKAAMAAHVTREGTYKGKLAYSAPEQMRGTATRQSDIFSLSVLLWELLAGQRMHGAARSGAELIAAVLHGDLPGIREVLRAGRAWDAIAEADRQSLERLEPIVRKGLAVEQQQRWSTAAEMEEALTAAAPPAPLAAVAAWLKRVGKSFLDARQRVIAAEEAGFRSVHAAYPARSSDPPHDSFVNLRGPGRGARSLPSDLIVSDMEALDRGHGQQRAGHGEGAELGHPYGRLLGPGSVLIAALALGLAIMMIWRRGAQESVPQPAVAPAASVGAAVTTGSAEVAASRPIAPERASEPDESERKADPGVAAASAPAPHVPFATPARRSDDAQPRVTRRARAVDVQREPAAAPAAPAQPAKVDDECALPYYFEGSKKLFKAACL